MWRNTVDLMLRILGPSDRQPCTKSFNSIMVSPPGYPCNSQMRFVEILRLPWPKEKLAILRFLHFNRIPWLCIIYPKSIAAELARLHPLSGRASRRVGDHCLSRYLINIGVADLSYSSRSPVSLKLGTKRAKTPFWSPPIAELWN